MKFHEKSLESNITHELLNLADSWCWFLTDIPLWRYWRPRYRLPFIKFPKSTSAGFHITTEGKDDPTGTAGGGFDIRIKAGIGKHLLFIQFKQGKLQKLSPSPKSIFSKAPHEHYVFEVNGTKTNQHFVLRNLAEGIGKSKGNAVVYAFPLIEDMDDMEANAGNLVRKTKFISIKDIDLEASKAKVEFKRNKQHNFRVGINDMNRCEVNYYYFPFFGIDRTPEIIADIIAVGFQKNLSYFLSEIKDNFKKYDLYEGYISFGLQQAFIQYSRYLFHYFEVSPSKLNFSFSYRINEYFYSNEFEKYLSSERDEFILNSIFEALKPFQDFIFNLDNTPESILEYKMPSYEPSFIIPFIDDNGIKIAMDEESYDIIRDLSYIAI